MQSKTVEGESLMMFDAIANALNDDFYLIRKILILRTLGVFFQLVSDVVNKQFLCHNSPFQPVYEDISIVLQWYVTF